MKRAVLSVAVVALCVAGSAMAQDRSGGLIGSGTRSDGQTMGSGNVVDQTVGSGNFVDQMMGSGGRIQDAGQATAYDAQVMGSGGLIGSGTRTDTSSPLLGSGAGVVSQDGGYLGSGNLVVELERWDGLRMLVVTSQAGFFVIPIED